MSCLNAFFLFLFFIMIIYYDYIYGGGGLVPKSYLTLVTTWTVAPVSRGSRPGSCVHGILQARIPVWAATSLSRLYTHTHTHTHKT